MHDSQLGWEEANDHPDRDALHCQAGSLGQSAQVVDHADHGQEKGRCGDNRERSRAGRLGR